MPAARNASSSSGHTCRCAATYSSTLSGFTRSTKPTRTDLPRVGEGDAAVDVEDVAGALRGSTRRGEVEDRLRDVGREDVHLQRRARAVVLLQLVRRDPVGACALLAPRRAPDPRALEHRVG